MLLKTRPFTQMDFWRLRLAQGGQVLFEGKTTGDTWLGIAGTVQGGVDDLIVRNTLNASPYRLDDGPATAILSSKNTPDATVRLLPNYPNPFNSSTTLRFALPTAAELHLVIYDTLGRKVKTLVDGTREAGLHQLTWDGYDSNGRTVASGMYVVHLQTDDHQQSYKLSLLR